MFPSASGTVLPFEWVSLFKVCRNSVTLNSITLSLDYIGFSPSLSHPISLDDEAFGYLKRVIVTPAVYPRLVEFLHFDIQSTGQKSLCVNTFSGHHKALFLLNSRIPRVRFSSELTVNYASKVCLTRHPYRSFSWTQRSTRFLAVLSDRWFHWRALTPSPQSQSISRSYGSNLPNSLIYIILSTRGC